MSKSKSSLIILASALFLAACSGTLEEEGTAASSESVASVESLESEESNNMESVVSESEEDPEEQAVLAAKEAVETQTGFLEGVEYVFIVDPEMVEGMIQIDVREENKEVASSVGLFRYDIDTGILYEQDYITGDFVEYPANP